MNRRLHAPALAATLAAAQLGLAACSIQVDKDEANHRANVDIDTIGGGVTVKAGIDAPATGLAVYPGATLARQHDGTEAADVNVRVPFVNVHVAAAKYESDDAPDKVLEFYRTEMKKYGEVVECHGDIDFPGGRMVCRDRGRANETQLGVGTEHRHRVVAVKPRNGRTELSMAYVETSGES